MLDENPMAVCALQNSARPVNTLRIHKPRTSESQFLGKLFVYLGIPPLKMKLPEVPRWRGTQIGHINNKELYNKVHIYKY